MNVSHFIRFVALFVLIAFAGCESLSVQIQEDDEIDSYENILMLDWLHYLCSEECAGRFVGTTGNRKASDYIVSQLESMGYEPHEQVFDFNGVQLRNIYIVITGEKDSCIVVGAHYDGQYESDETHHYPAANDNASGVVTLLRVAYNFSQEKLLSPYNIYLCFWDGEENNYGSAFKGSSYFVNTFPLIDFTKYYQNLDYFGHDHSNQFIFFYYDEIIKRYVLPFITKEYPFQFTEISKREKGEGTSDHVSFSKVGIPAFGIYNDHTNGCSHYHHTVSDIPEAISLQNLETMANLVEDVILLNF